MKRPYPLLILLLLFASMFAACAPAATPGGATATPIPNATETPTVDGGDSAVAELVIALLRQITGDQPALVSLEPEQWPDGCLGLPATDESCTSAITPGYRVVLDLQGQQYVYRTNEDGSDIRLESAPEPEIGDLIVTWRSATAPCQQAQIGSEGVAFGRCGGALQQGRFVTEERSQQAAELAQNYRSFADTETPAGWVSLQGTGSLVAAPSEQRMIAEWAGVVAQEAALGRSGASWAQALTWHREGGIAGFCDDLQVDLTGLALASTCQSDGQSGLGERWLTADEAAQLFAWIDTLAPFELNRTDPATADAMTIRLLFSGQGTTEASEADQTAILDFITQLYTRWALPTDVTYALALEDLVMVDAPAADAAEIGGIFAGQTMLVTGVSVDGDWWRVVCPDDMRGNCWVSADPTQSEPTTPPDASSISDEDRIAIYEAVIRQIYTVDHTFGGSPNFPVVYLLANDEGGLTGEPLPLDPAMQAAIVEALADLPAEFKWITDINEVPREGGDFGPVAGNGAVITAGPIEPQSNGIVTVAGSIYIAPLAAGGQTYVIENQNGGWQITGTTGPSWIS